MNNREKTGRLVVIEGLDGSGKGTQAKLLAESFRREGGEIRQISFPDYDSPSSALVKMYLAGEFGESASAVNAYAASSFYAVDRFASFHTDWKKDYEAGRLILADRYVTSNIIYQLGKLPQEQWDEYMEWLQDFEYNRLALPQPDQVIFLDMPIGLSQQLISGRYHGDESRKDIHERDLRFLREAETSARYAAKRLGWQIVHCAQGDAPRSVEAIHEEIKACVMKIR